GVVEKQVIASGGRLKSVIDGVGLVGVANVYVSVKGDPVHVRGGRGAVAEGTDGTADVRAMRIVEGLVVKPGRRACCPAGVNHGEVSSWPSSRWRRAVLHHMAQEVAGIDDADAHFRTGIAGRIRKLRRDRP